MTKAWLIDSTAQEIRAIEFEGVEGMGKAVGGYIELAMILPSGDVIYVDGDGMHKPQTGFFMLSGRAQPLAGNGILVGREEIDRDGEFTGNAPPAATAEQLAQIVRYFTRAQVEAWGKANASEPATTFHTLGPDGKVVASEVMKRWGEVIAEIPRPSFTCPICGSVSHNPNDIRERYCGACHVFTSDR